jgi:hypothetical protein
MPTARELDNENISYTYADYLGWETDKRYEIIDGETYIMVAPSVSRQAISRELLLQFGNFLTGKPCQVFAAPLDVQLFPKRGQQRQDYRPAGSAGGLRQMTIPRPSGRGIVVG